MPTILACALDTPADNERERPDTKSVASVAPFVGLISAALLEVFVHLEISRSFLAQSLKEVLIANIEFTLVRKRGFFFQKYFHVLIEMAESYTDIVGPVRSQSTTYF